MGSLKSQALDMENDPFLRPIGDQPLEAAHQPRQPIDQIGEGLQPLAHACLRPAIVAHPAFDQGPREPPDVDLGIEPSSQSLKQHHRLLQQQELRLGFHLELLGYLEQLSEKSGD